MLRDRLKQIIPGVEVEAIRAMMKGERAEELLAGRYVCMYLCIFITHPSLYTYMHDHERYA